MTLVCNFCILKNYCLFVFDYNDVSRIRLITKKICVLRNPGMLSMTRLVGLLLSGY
jgi:hypothetical protein